MALVVGQKMKDAVWREFGGAEFLIARAGTNEHLRITDEVFKPYQKQVEKGTLSRVKNRELLMEVVSQALIVDWKGLETPDGKEFEYNAENVKWMLQNYDGFADFVIETASDASSFYAEEVKKTAKK